MSEDIEGFRWVIGVQIDALRALCVLVHYLLNQPQDLLDLRSYGAREFLGLVYAQKEIVDLRD